MGKLKNEPSFQQQVFSMIERETGNSNIIAVHQEIMRFAGDLETGVFLSQLIYWADKGAGGGAEFFYKTIAEWREETFLSEYAIRAAIKKLVKNEILKVKVKRANNFPVLHYHFLRENFIKSFLRFQRNGTVKSKKRNCENAETLTETTYRNYLQKEYKRSKASFASYKRRFKEEDSEAIEVFETFWDLYPSRNGKKLYKKEAQKKFFKVLKSASSELLLQAVRNYRSSKSVTEEYAKDAVKFLKDDYWRDWLEPENTGRKEGIVARDAAGRELEYLD